MKQLTALSLGLLLALATGPALADGKHHDAHRYRENYRHGEHYSRHYRRPPYRHPPPYRFYGGGYYYYPLGAALIGSAVTYSLYHTHDGVCCYEGHAAGTYPAPDAGSEVVGCHRIERYPDGSERRVELPLSECY